MEGINENQTGHFIWEFDREHTNIQPAQRVTY
jgi:hypothetical protein